ncbi:MAG TPA: thioredoxin domain-containing protein [bacterium]|nr:thioredoxin domain-containing protein [bacterium]
MGDGVQRNFALIINGDDESRHLGNVDRAIKTLRSEAPYEISVASRKPPSNSVEHFIAPHEQSLKRLIEGIRSKIDDDDLLVVYITGHGGAGNQREGCVEWPGACYPLSSLGRELKNLLYGKRIVVMDQCFSGGGLPLFADDRTYVVTQGGPDETVSCQEFSPYFWGDGVTDLDGDGIKTVEERFIYAVKTGKTPTHTQYYAPGSAISLSGKADKTPPFKAGVTEVHDQRGVEAELKRLQPGQLALVMFSSETCDACKRYAPTFEGFSRQFGGRFLMIRAEGVNGSEEDWGKHYGVDRFPKVAFINHRGQVTFVEDRARPLDSLVAASGYDVLHGVRVYAAQLESPHRDEREKAIAALAKIGRNASPKKEDKEALSLFADLIGQSPARVLVLAQWMANKNVGLFSRWDAENVLTDLTTALMEKEGDLLRKSANLLKKQTALLDKTDDLLKKGIALAETGGDREEEAMIQKEVAKIKQEVEKIQKLLDAIDVEISVTPLILKQIAVPLLTKILLDESDSPTMRRKAAVALERMKTVGWIKKPAATPALIEDLNLKSAEELSALMDAQWRGWRFGGGAVLNYFEGPGAGSHLWAGYRRYRWDFRVNLRGEGLKLDKTGYGFRMDISIEPIVHIFDRPARWDPYLNLPEVGVSHHFGKNVWGLSFSPLGAGLQLHLNDNWSAYAGARLRGAVTPGEDVRVGAEIPLGFSGSF